MSSSLIWSVVNFHLSLKLSGKYDVVINCSGLGARHLVPDPEVIPVRGQVMRVHAPWPKHGVMLDNDFYILPNSEETILGGTHQEDDWRLEPDPEDSKKYLGRLYRNNALSQESQNLKTLGGPKTLQINPSGGERP
ncbi:d-aspartate oxidase [Caerostris extrusa]|uniref:D-aspartate oxidase n=1 Tax=Caerostris extrusa TaxID=172846 RepID=A0AAV4XVW0_CAEEX|nr:d-aspartate oxidase [Caerostris extrusa]